MGFLQDYGPLLGAGLTAFGYPGAGLLVSGAAGLGGQRDAQQLNQDSIRAAIDSNNSRAQAEYEAQLQYLSQVHEARQAAAAARAAAERARIAQGQKAIGVLRDYTGRGISELQPYADAGRAVLPNITNLYNASSGLLGAYLTTPGALNQFNTSVPTSQVNIPIPDYLGA